jgi:hypothetical protein
MTSHACIGARFVISISYGSEESWDILAIYISSIAFIVTLYCKAGNFHVQEFFANFASGWSSQKCYVSKISIFFGCGKTASTVTWSLVLQTRNLMNKIEEFWKCDDFSGEIRSLTEIKSMLWLFFLWMSLVNVDVFENPTNQVFDTCTGNTSHVSSGKH